MCCIGARCAQKWRRTCCQGQLGRLQHMRHDAVALRFSVVLGCWQTPSLRQLCAVALALICSASDAVSAHVAAKNGGALVLGATGVFKAPETRSSSSAWQHHAWRMQANAVSQRAVWVLVLRTLNDRVSDAVSMGGRRRNGGATISGADGVLAASATLSTSFALQHHARMQAVAVSQRAA